jgi:L-seryl-tRNA(Ser) seleniumtransferase
MKLLPQVDKVMRHPAIVAREVDMRRDCLLSLVRYVLEAYRQKIYLGKDKDRAADAVDEEVVVRDVLSLADSLLAGSLQKVINGTGIILSTNLGRAPLPPVLVEKVATLLTGYSSLEIQLENGQRGERASAVERLLCVLTGCEAAAVVNNNAAAVLLVMNALSSGKEVVVSRGELIEIGGSFRLPDVIKAGGAILKEVGTTNRTRLSDYENAVSDQTALLLKCHRSNFEISGYTEDADSADLKKLGEAKGLPVVEDLGSGALLDLSVLGLKHEPTVQETLRNADLVLFSGDKLLGGSQAGLIVGKRELVERLRKHPIYRALRLDKVNIVLLESLLAEYLRADVIDRLPAYHFAAIPEKDLAQRARAISERLNNQLKNLHCAAVAVASAFGGGTTPNQTIPSHGLRVGIAPGIATAVSIRKLSNLLRSHRPAIMSLTSDDAVVIDLRCITHLEEKILEDAFAEIDNRLQGN